MKQVFPKYMSHNYKLDLENFPAKANDRLSLKVVISAVVVGLLMVLIGVLEMNNKLYMEQSADSLFFTVDSLPFLSNIFVDYAFIIVGASIVLWSLISYIRYKKIYFNGRSFDVSFKGIFGETEMFDELLRNFRGVRMRVEFCQFGILTKNKYIIELEHIDAGKTIPLYISTDNSGIYDIWRYYAKRLDKPTIVDSDEGLKVVEPKDLNKTLRDYIMSAGFSPSYVILPPQPRIIKYYQKKEKIVLSVKKAFWDMYNTIAFVWWLAFSIFYAIALYNYDKISAMANSQWKLNTGLVLLGLLLFISMLWLFKREKIVIKDGRIILIYNFFFISRKNEDVSIEQLKDIEVLHNPLSSRFYLALISQYKVAVFGSKMPLEYLRWIKKFLIREILK
ncbi:MAG: hypothetical protein J6Y53_05855 [Alphaproteobacteria bacterium]|nr:hypothetical protein [Alphaproteobacteria bacterium]